MRPHLLFCEMSACCRPWPMTLPVFKEPISVTDSPQEPFPFFNLPNLVIHTILKDYVPFPDKVDTLSQIEAFKPFLTSRNVLNPLSYPLYQWMRDLESGWYVDSYSIHNRYYVAVDYVRATCTVYSFCTHFENIQNVEYFKQTSVPTTVVQHVLHNFRQFQLIRIPDHHILVYRFYRETYPGTLCCWIFVPEKIVCWGIQCNQYQLNDDNTCIIPASDALHNHDMTLTLEKDETVVLTCQVHPNHPCSKKNTLRFQPLSYQFCPSPGECTCNGNHPSRVHAVSILTFSLCDKEKATMRVTHCVTKFQLLLHNVISMLNLKEEKKRTKRYVVKFWRRMFPRAIQICDLSA